jgi:hypothetical protein
MEQLITVKSAKYISDYILELSFSDGLSGEVDFSDWITKYPFFEPLKDTDYFKNFKVDAWTVVWPNGADIAPETLYDIASGKGRLQAA